MFGPGCRGMRARLDSARTMSTRPEIEAAELREVWWDLSTAERVDRFRVLAPNEAEEFFFDLDPSDQSELLIALEPAERRRWLRLLAPDDAADLVQETDEEHHAGLLVLLDETKRKEVAALLAYAEDEAGGLMSSRFARVRPEMTVDAAIAYLRRQAVSSIEPETIYYVYVLDARQHLLGVVSFRDLFAAPGEHTIREVMRTEVVTVQEELDQEAVARVLTEHDLLAVPVVDRDGVLKGIVTVDDVVDVVEEEATEDIQKYGAMEALEEPYLRIGFVSLVRKRAGWMVVLFTAQLVTTSVIARFETRLAERVQSVGDLGALAFMLMAFLPLIISSGGNSGSQASTLVIRAMALGEVRIRDWLRVARRELATGVTLGLILGALGLLRVVVGNAIGEPASVGWIILAGIVSTSLVGVVIFGTLVGSMLPFLLRIAGLDPASASAPLVATISDVTGLLIYFSIAISLLARFLSV